MTALTLQKTSGKRLGAIFIDLGLIEPPTLIELLAEQLGLAVADLRRMAPEPDAIAALSESSAGVRAMPLRVTSAGLDVAVADPDVVERLEEATGRSVRALLATPSDIDQAIEQFYKNTEQVGEAVRAFETLQAARAPEEAAPRPVVDENAPVVQVVNLILEQAVRDRASDVHIEPARRWCASATAPTARCTRCSTLPESMALSLVSRIKIMAN